MDKLMSVIVALPQGGQIALFICSLVAVVFVAIFSLMFLARIVKTIFACKKIVPVAASLSITIGSIVMTMSTGTDVIAWALVLVPVVILIYEIAYFCRYEGTSRTIDPS